MIAESFAHRESYSQWVRRTVARRRSGQRMISLFDSSVPEPSERLAEIVSAAFREPVDPRYTSAFADGNPYVVEHLCRTYGVGADSILCTTGVTSALALLYRTFARRGGRILVETPGFDLFDDLACGLGVEVDCFVRQAPDFALDLDRIEAAIRPDTRFIVLSDLHNPSGALAERETLLGLAGLAERHDLIVLVDEVYGDYASAEARPIHAAGLSPRLITISSLSKIYGLGTLRCGWIVGHPDLLAQVRQVSERTEFGISSLAHAAAALVMDEAPQFHAWAMGILAESRPCIEDHFSRWQHQGLVEGVLPQFGCMAFPRLVGKTDTAGFAERLANTTGVIVAPGEFFGAPGHIRIGFVRRPDELDQALDVLGMALASDAGS